MELNRDKAEALLHEYTTSESLRKHACSVEAAMVFYAQRFGEDPVLWGITGLLHDFDYERYPSAEEHPYVGNRILRELGYPVVMLDAIMGHAKYTGIERKSLLAKTLFACDELCGLVTASVLVRPDRSIEGLEARSVRKKMKDKAFARGVDREDIVTGAAELGVELEEHIENVITAMRARRESLGL
jgi:predicted hydrolase (HD superfamily)